jgi:hypothetical protein
LLCSSFLLMACNKATPENYFDIAVLNSNMFVGFAGNGLLRQFDAPPAKMQEANGVPVAMKRREVAAMNIKFTEEAYEKLKSLKETAETKAMLQTSQAMYEYILPVYKKEYVTLAELYDSGAAKEKIEAQAKMIHDKYYTGFNVVYEKLISIGKSYAAAHHIKVNWGV